MRPIPHTRHLLAVMIFAGVSAVAGYMAFIDDRISTTQVDVATVALKRHQPDLLKNDPVFGDDVRWRFHTPFLQSLLEVILLPTGYRDLTLPFKLLTGIVVFIYLGGIYGLLYRQCGSWSISAYVAILSTAVTYTLGRSYWGVGPLASITPQTLVQAILPLILLSYLHYERQWRVILVFGFVGICANLHWVTAANVTIVLLIVYMGRHHFRPSCWPTAAGALAAALLASAPYTLYFLHMRYANVPAEAAISTEAVYQAFRAGNLAILYPDMLKSLLYWLLLALVLLVPAVGVLSRVERFRVRDLSVWVWFAVGAFFLSLAVHGLCQLLGVIQGKAPPFIDFARAANLVMLPLYILFAQALTNLFRLARNQRPVLRWACAAFMVAWMLPSDNLRVARHLGYNMATAFMEPDQKPPRVQEIISRQQRKQELTAIAQWAKDQSHPDAVFLVEKAEFRMMSRRAIAVSGEDVKYYYYVTPWRLEQWLGLVNRQKAVLRSPTGTADSEAIVNFVRDLRASGRQNVPQWYVILRTKDAPANPGEMLPIAQPEWGEYYRLFQVK